MPDELDCTIDGYYQLHAAVDYLADFTLKQWWRDLQDGKRDNNMLVMKDRYGYDATNTPNVLASHCDEWEKKMKEEHEARK